MKSVLIAGAFALAMFLLFKYTYEKYGFDNYIFQLIESRQLSEQLE